MAKFRRGSIPRWITDPNWSLPKDLNPYGAYDVDGGWGHSGLDCWQESEHPQFLEAPLRGWDYYASARSTPLTPEIFWEYVRAVELPWKIAEAKRVHTEGFEHRFTPERILVDPVGARKDYEYVSRYPITWRFFTEDGERRHPGYT